MGTILLGLEKIGAPKYGVVWGILFLGSLSPSSELFLVSGFFALLASAALRVPWAALLVLALPFDHLLVFEFASTFSVSHLVLPLALVQELRVFADNKSSRFKVARSLSYFLIWGGLLLACVSTSFVGKEVIAMAFLIAVAKFSISMLFGLLAVLVISNCDGGKQRLRLLGKLWLLGASSQILLASIGLVASWFGENPAWVYSTTRMLGTFNNPNSLALFLLASLAIAVGLSWERRRWSAHLLVALITLGIFGTGSLAAQIAALVAGITGLVVLALIRDNRYTLALNSLLVAVVGALYSLFLEPYVLAAKQRLVSGRIIGLEGATPLEVGINQAVAIASDVRWSLWDEALQLFLGSPWFGVGFGQFIELNSFGLDAHNSHFQLLVEGGIFTYVLFLSGILLAYVRSLQVRGASLTLTIWHFGILVFGLGNGVVNSPSFWLLTGVVFALANAQKDNDVVVVKRY